MQFLKGLLISAVLGMVFCAAILPEGSEKARIVDFFGKAILLTFTVTLMAYAVRFVLWRRNRAAIPEAAPAEVPSGKHVIVDGSNVMHWGGEPSFTVLTRVLKELQHRGYGPLVYFDANVGYKLFNKHVGSKDMARRLGLPTANVVHAPSRIPADEILLERAMQDGLSIVTNDRFLDWKSRYPKVGESGFLVKGKWQEGSVILLGLGRKSTNRAA